MQSPPYIYNHSYLAGKISRKEIRRRARASSHEQPDMPFVQEKKFSQYNRIFCLRQVSLQIYHFAYI